jgi:hypothetical protein
MSKVTLLTILNEVQKNNARLDQMEAKNDDRFELIKQEFQLVRSDLQLESESIRSEFKSELKNGLEVVRSEFKSELKSELKTIRTEITQFRSEVNNRFDRVENSIALVAVQTLEHVDNLKALSLRVTKLETRGP